MWVGWVGDGRQWWGTGGEGTCSRLEKGRVGEGAVIRHVGEKKGGEGWFGKGRGGEESGGRSE